MPELTVTHFMYRRPILCTLYGAVDFLKEDRRTPLGAVGLNVSTGHAICPEEGLLVGGGEGVLLVHSEIYYVPIGDGWTQVLVRNVIHYAELGTSLL
jgi:hypothetical protein